MFGWVNEKFIDLVIFVRFNSVTMTADSELEIRETFQRAQKAHNNKAKLVANLKNTYVKVKLLIFLNIHMFL